MSDINAQHAKALHMDAMLEDLQYQETGTLESLRTDIHAYTGPDTSGLNAVIAERVDELLAKRH